MRRGQPATRIGPQAVPARSAPGQYRGRSGAGFPAGEHLVIGIDLAKSKYTLERAYDDVVGVTAAFKLQPTDG